MSRADEVVDKSTETPVEIDDVLTQLNELKETMTTPEQRRELQETKHLLERLPGGELLDDQIDKYTSRDMGEAFVGSIIFALPLLVEDGVFEIANHFVTFLVAGIPVFFIANVLFVIKLAAGLLYVVDFREVAITHPLFGIVPRRLVGVLTVSFLTTAGLMLMWGRLFADDPTSLEMLARITVIWAAAALGASLGDILPGESKGTDLTLSNISELIGDDTQSAEADSLEHK